MFAHNGAFDASKRSGRAYSLVKLFEKLSDSHASRLASETPEKRATTSRKLLLLDVHHDCFGHREDPHVVSVSNVSFDGRGACEWFGSPDDVTTEDELRRLTRKLDRAKPLPGAKVENFVFRNRDPGAVSADLESVNVDDMSTHAEEIAELRAKLAWLPQGWELGDPVPTIPLDELPEWADATADLDDASQKDLARFVREANENALHQLTSPDQWFAVISDVARGLEGFFNEPNSTESHRAFLHNEVQLHYDDDEKTYLATLSFTVFGSVRPDLRVFSWHFRNERPWCFFEKIGETEFYVMNEDPRNPYKPKTKIKDESVLKHFGLCEDRVSFENTPFYEYFFRKLDSSPGNVVVPDYGFCETGEPTLLRERKKACEASGSNNAGRLSKEDHRKRLNERDNLVHLRIPDLKTASCLFCPTSTDVAYVNGEVLRAKHGEALKRLFPERKRPQNHVGFDYLGKRCDSYRVRVLLSMTQFQYPDHVHPDGTTVRSKHRNEEDVARLSELLSFQEQGKTPSLRGFLSPEELEILESVDCRPKFTKEMEALVKSSRSNPTKHKPPARGRSGPVQKNTLFSYAK